MVVHQIQKKQNVNGGDENEAKNKENVQALGIYLHSKEKQKAPDKNKKSRN